jgi:hypothetical protein
VCAPARQISAPTQTSFDFDGIAAHARGENPLTRVNLLAALLLAAASMPAASQDGPSAVARPAWAVDGVPDSVWRSVESALAEEDKGRTKTMLKDAEAEARSALAGHEGVAGRRFALALVLGLRVEREGGKTKINIASEMKKELEATLAIDPLHGRARHLRGRLSASVLRMSAITRFLATSILGGGELKKASWQEAESDLVFAEVQVPGVSDHHLQLANLYRDTKRPELARVEVEHVLALPFHSTMEAAVHAEALKLKKKLR